LNRRTESEAGETKKSPTGFAFSGKVVELLNEKYSRELEQCKTPKEIAKLLENISTKERLRIRYI
jgi:hypothetical protein